MSVLTERDYIIERQLRAIIRIPKAFTATGINRVYPDGVKNYNDNFLSAPAGTERTYILGDKLFEEPTFYEKIKFARTMIHGGSPEDEVMAMIREGKVLTAGIAVREHLVSNGWTREEAVDFLDRLDVQHGPEHLLNPDDSIAWSDIYPQKLKEVYDHLIEWQETQERERELAERTTRRK